ncbi:hypothetical protein Alches_20180 [Alicyclobacillus hesperidum subsp. aegles]|uniref:Uncharacterized protein n=1 Tax=Alicyclobacillus hesperidum TaxID=89784 RepID=A0A1H2VSQ8_9BACL|nr:hypothetical protein [Alicyclobacillus hesperidum]KRW92137.1 hypothetical protein SD51_04850 [Alicyclobacillus tengchongensis]GLG01977.1 hypothetical protein Alches_20180 [Alicyclobacillus hesperidum subsp. aegles]SDW71442.1 hypothetical protein SAMN04489725_11211 [Alicyclobacillus hesperidum]
MTYRRDLYAKYGGVHFVQLAPGQDINKFVRSLPEAKRDSLFEVLHELDQAGLIAIQNDHQILDHEGEIHPAEPGSSSEPR